MPFLPILALLIIAGIVSWLISETLLLTYAIGMIIGTALLFSGLRKLGKKARRSMIAAELVYTITGYRPVNIPPPQQIIKVPTTDYSASHDYADMIDVLKNQMRFPAKTAQEAAKYAISTAQDKPLEEKIKMALQYLGTDKNIATRD